MKKNPNVLLHEGHKKPVTRRDFLSAGLLSFSGYVMAPSILQLLAADPAFAADAVSCIASTAARMPAFVSVNLVGGASLAGNYIVLDKGRNMYTDYSVMGLGRNPPVEKDFQGVGFGGVVGGRLTSQFLAGLRSGATDTTRAKTSFLAIAHPSQDDSNINKTDCSGLVTAAGVTGSLLPKLGTSETGTGTNNDFALTKPPSPLVVKKLADLQNALLPSGALANLTPAQRFSMMKLVNKLSASQSAAIASPNSASGTTLAQLVQCATGKNVDLSTPGANSSVDPSASGGNADIISIWGMNTTGAAFGQAQSSRQAMAAMVYNALNGQAGTVGLDLGGYDYHGQPRQAAGGTDEKDFNAGAVIGKVLESAAKMGKKVFVHVTSDGGISAQTGSDITVGYTSDHGISGMCFILAFDPAGRPAVKDDALGSQLGYFTMQMGASAVNDAPVGSAEAAGIATFTNYMKFAGAMDAFETMLNRQYTAAQLDQIVRFS